MARSPSTPASAPALGDVRARREDLRARIVEFEAAVGDEARPDPSAWWEGVRPALRALREEFQHHVEVTERPDGFLDEVVAHAPHLARRRRELERDHVSITAELAALDEAPFVEDAGGAASARERAVQAIASLERHCHKGAEFIYDAYNVEIGPCD